MALFFFWGLIQLDCWGSGGERNLVCHRPDLSKGAFWCSLMSCVVQLYRCSIKVTEKQLLLPNEHWTGMSEPVPQEKRRLCTWYCISVDSLQWGGGFSTCIFFLHFGFPSIKANPKTYGMSWPCNIHFKWLNLQSHFPSLPKSWKTV